VDPDGEAPRQGLGERPRRIAEGVLLAVQQLSASACCPIGHC
jgi:hypothetical protein